jgi:hypothetical protein
MSERERAAGDPGTPAGYEPPRVERLLDAAALAREILYAGTARQALSPGLDQ